MVWSDFSSGGQNRPPVVECMKEINGFSPGGQNRSPVVDFIKEVNGLERVQPWWSESTSSSRFHEGSQWFGAISALVIRIDLQ